ncbi:MAG: hypothetical protein E7597_03750 [Ruminococcaceae bacterium]|nr:hypothetical protein [Oscillospiraceae bacterium]
MRAEGVVVSVNGDNVTVSVVQQSACAGCNASCASCHKKIYHDLTVQIQYPPNSVMLFGWRALPIEYCLYAF